MNEPKAIVQAEAIMRGLLCLYRIKVSLFAALSAAAAYVLASDHLHAQVVFVPAGVFLLACGASGLNQYQEQTTDAMMPRTKGRPIPSGQITRRDALLFSLAPAFAGFMILLAGSGPVSAAFGLFALIWYNGVYTSLKKKSAFAAIPGALTGALPPVIGWSGAGGNISDPALPALALFFAVWQAPHFWLFLLSHGDEYEAAGLPTLTRILSRRQITRIVFQWIAATAVCGPSLVLFGLAHEQFTQYSLIAASVLLVCFGLGFAFYGRAAQSMFGRLNAYMAAVMALLVSDRLYSIAGSLPARVEKLYAMIAVAWL